MIKFYEMGNILTIRRDHPQYAGESATVIKVIKTAEGPKSYIVQVHGRSRGGFPVEAEIRAKDYLDVPKIKFSDVKIGEAAAYIENKQAVAGLFKGWEVYSPFEITDEIYQSMLSKIPTNGELIQNKTARIISLIEDIHGNVSGALVIWQNYHQYFCAMLFTPDMDSL